MFGATRTDRELLCLVVRRAAKRRQQLVSVHAHVHVNANANAMCGEEAAAAGVAVAGIESGDLPITISRDLP